MGPFTSNWRAAPVLNSKEVAFKCRAASDCDDSDPNTYPGAAENDSETECMTDADGDGYGSDASVSPVTAGTDCDDSNADIHPEATETEGDGVDSNCNGDDTN